MGKKIFKLALILVISLGISCDQQTQEETTTGKSTISALIQNLNDTTLIFTFEEYEFLSEQEKPRVKVENGRFALEIEHDRPLKGFFSLGRVPKTYEFTITTVEGRDSSLQVGSADFRMIYIYLEPGDSVHFETDANALEETLEFSGSAAVNNTFVNTEEFTFNDYRHKYLGNYYNKTYRQPDDYKHVSYLLRDEKKAFLEQFDIEHPISPKLKAHYLKSYYTEVVSSLIHYPAGHAGFNDGQFPELPEDYYDFMSDVNTSGAISDLGIGQYYFLNSYLRQKYKMENPEDSDLEGFYTAVQSQLLGKQAYEFLAYALGRDFSRELYEAFGEDCPYPELASSVKEKYQHLEGMLAGNPAPVFRLENPYGEMISLEDFRGHYVYIDFWATWCKPCVKEFPDLHRMQTEYKDKDITFISISIDREEDKEKWKSFLATEKPGGIQLHADTETKERLSKVLNIKSIPRFVLIDPDGKIIDANAPRPSNPKLVWKYFSTF